jgi:hypothetical protein
MKGELKRNPFVHVLNAETNCEQARETQLTPGPEKADIESNFSVRQREALDLVMRSCMFSLDSNQGWIHLGGCNKGRSNAIERRVATNLDDNPDNAGGWCTSSDGYSGVITELDGDRCWQYTRCDSIGGGYHRHLYRVAYERLKLPHETGEFAANAVGSTMKRQGGVETEHGIGRWLGRDAIDGKDEWLDLKNLTILHRLGDSPVVIATVDVDAHCVVMLA